MKNSAIELRDKSIEISKKIGKLDSAKTPLGHHNEAVNSVKNAGEITPLEFFRQVYNYLIEKLNNLKYTS